MKEFDILKKLFKKDTWTCVMGHTLTTRNPVRALNFIGRHETCEIEVES